jgi:hypothetical protein
MIPHDRCQIISHSDGQRQLWYPHCTVYHGPFFTITQEENTVQIDLGQQN